MMNFDIRVSGDGTNHGGPGGDTRIGVQISYNGVQAPPDKVMEDLPDIAGVLAALPHTWTLDEPTTCGHCHGSGLVEA